MAEVSKCVMAIGNIIALLALCAQSLAAQAQEATCKMTSSEVYTEVSPSVVQVFSLAINPFLVADRIAPRIGSGFVVDEGYVVTNYHVIADAQTIIVYQDDEAFDVEVKGIDPTLDVALLKPRSAKPIGLPLEFANGKDVKIGQSAFAIGFPLGLGKSITTGTVSGVDRITRRTTTGWLSPYLQTDAAISPGNSGGPLIDSCGQVIGMIVSGISDHGAENIGFAIPSDVLQPVASALAKNGYVSRAWHGLYGQMASPLILNIMGVPSEDWPDKTGFLIETIEPESAADEAGLRGGNWPMMWGGTEILIGGDIITYVNGIRIDNLDVALNMVRQLRVSETVELVVIRDGEPFTTSITLRERPMLSQELEIYRHPTRN